MHLTIMEHYLTMNLQLNNNRFVSLELDGQIIVEAQNDGVLPNMDSIKNNKRYSVDIEFYEDDDRYVKKVIVNQTR